MKRFKLKVLRGSAVTKAIVSHSNGLMTFWTKEVGNYYKKLHFQHFIKKLFIIIIKNFLFKSSDQFNRLESYLVAIDALQFQVAKEQFNKIFSANPNETFWIFITGG